MSENFIGSAVEFLSRPGLRKLDESLWSTPPKNASELIIACEEEPKFNKFFLKNNVQRAGGYYDVEVFRIPLDVFKAVTRIDERGIEKIGNATSHYDGSVKVVDQGGRKFVSIWAGD